ncbi:MAG: ATP-binding protein [Bacteroidetes bacterium]|nr:ATP-binding protein [Bacteroidota bacterium]MCY4233618.1 ATP-binding protein [Bacteroidota bacterium]
MRQKRLDLKLASTFDELERAIEALQDFIPTLELDEDLAYRVILLASEALTNAIEHGNKWNQKKEATLSLVKQDRRIELIVTDEGDGLHWTHKNPLEEKNRLSHRGRGQYFMREMADEVHIDEDHCKLRLVFHCSS